MICKNCHYAGAFPGNLPGKAKHLPAIALPMESVLLSDVSLEYTIHPQSVNCTHWYMGSQTTALKLSLHIFYPIYKGYPLFLLHEWSLCSICIFPPYLNSPFILLLLFICKSSVAVHTLLPAFLHDIWTNTSPWTESSCNSSAQDFALAAKSVRMRKFSRRIQPFANSKL